MHDFHIVQQVYANARETVCSFCLHDVLRLRQRSGPFALTTDLLVYCVEQS
eukprot:m.31334 g.31334  ORF g.31334 m.31334 type:complete len:51 (+) comp10682_c0_seq4:778-930(+)